MWFKVSKWVPHNLHKDERTVLSMLCLTQLVLSQQEFVLIKTSWRHLSSSSSEYIFKTSARRLDQDKYICLSHKPSEDVFKTFSRRLGQDQFIHFGHTSSRRLKGRTAKTVIYRRSCLSDTSEKFMVTLLHTLVAAYRGVFRTLWNDYNGALFANILNGFKLLTISTTKSSIADVRLDWK